MEIKLAIDHDGNTYSGQIMRIKSTRLTFEDHGILTAWLMCEYPGGGIGIGGYCLDESTHRETPVAPYERRGTAYGLDHIMRLIETVGVDSWEQLPGKQVIVLFAGPGGIGASSVGIAGILNGKVLILKDHAALFTETP